MTTNLLRKGVVLPGYVAPEKGLHEGLWFTYRPMLAVDGADLEEKYEKANRHQSARAATDIISQEVAKRITWWSETQGDAAEPVTPEAFACLPPTLWRRVSDIVRGRDAIDFPEKGSDEEQEFALLQKTAKDQSKNTAQATLEHISGN